MVITRRLPSGHSFIPGRTGFLGDIQVKYMFFSDHFYQVQLVTNRQSFLGGLAARKYTAERSQRILLQVFLADILPEFIITP